MVEGCGMATMDKCYKTLPLNDTTPQNLIEVKHSMSFYYHVIRSFHLIS